MSKLSLQKILKAFYLDPEARAQRRVEKGRRMLHRGAELSGMSSEEAEEKGLLYWRTPTLDGIPGLPENP
jgi:hypothetical protein